MITVPWLIVQAPRGEQVFGYATAGVTLLLVFFLPYYGWVLDRFSRKRVLLAGEAVAIGATTFFTLLAFLADGLQLWHLVALYTVGTVYWSIHYPALFALNQEIFERDQYAQLASLAEIQGQTASVISGGLAAFLIGRIDLSWMVLGSLVLFTASFALFASVPYPPSVARIPSTASAWVQVGEGLRYLAERPRFGLFLTCAFLPFAGVMIGNFLFPIYASRTLGAEAWVFGAVEVTFALGAVTAGFSIRRLSGALGNFRTMAITVAVCALSAAGLALFPDVVLYLFLGATFGWGNAGSRVARSTILLQQVPNALIGRVNVLFNLFERLLRTVVLSAITAKVSATGPQFGFGLIAIMTGLAWLGVMASRRAVPEEEVSPAREARSVPVK